MTWCRSRRASSCHHALKMAKQQGTKVVITGEANDELSCGHGEMITIRDGYYRRWLPFSRLPGRGQEAGRGGRAVRLAQAHATSCGAPPRARSTSGTSRSPGPSRRWAASCRPTRCGRPRPKAAGGVVARDVERLRASAHGNARLPQPHHLPDDAGLLLRQPDAREAGPARRPARAGRALPVHRAGLRALRLQHPGQVQAEGRGGEVLLQEGDHRHPAGFDHLPAEAGLSYAGQRAVQGAAGRLGTGCDPRRWVHAARASCAASCSPS